MDFGWWVALEAAWIAGLAVWIVLERRSANATLAWIFGLALLPAVGVPIYLLMGPRRLERQRRRYQEALARRAGGAGVTAPPVAVPRDIERQVRLAVGAGEAPLLFATRLDFHHDGADAFAAVRQAIAAARHHLHLEFYIWEPGRLGAELRDLLAERARAGVEVRLLVDAVGSYSTPTGFFAPLVAAGGEFEWFHPTALRYLHRRFLNFRTHRKIVVADGVRGFTGGMNVSDHQTVGKDGEPPWRDCQLALAGPAVAGLQAVFLENWHYAHGASPAGEAYFPACGELPLAWVQVLSSGPDREVYPIHELFVSAIAAADRRVWLATPYFVPDEAIVVALRLAAHRGVDVRVIVPARSDSRLVDAAMRSYYDELTAAGARLFEYGAALMHAKTLVVDQELAVVSTANLDNRSLRLNFEVAVAIHGARSAEELALRFAHDLAATREVPAGRASRIGFGRRLGEATARLFSPAL